MVLPGVQALFGFQLIAVFNRSFATRLTQLEQELHLLALGLVAVSVALLMTPASLHRQLGPREASDRFLRVAGRLLLWSMPPLLLAMGIDFYLIGHLILKEAEPAAGAAVALLAFAAFFWFALPRMYLRRYHKG